MAKAGAADPVTGIRTLAADLIDEVAFAEPPFKPEMLASFQNVREVRLKPMQSAARLFPDVATRTLIIEVNEAHSRGKRNFSVDHETTHTLIPTYSDTVIDDPVTGTFTSGIEEEVLCDVGASALLLDVRWLRPLAEDSGPSLSTLFALAELFDASLEATARSLVELNVWPCAFVFWEEGFRKSERFGSNQSLLPLFEGYGMPQPKLRVKRPYVSEGFGIFIPENKSVDETSLVSTCSNPELVTYGTELFDFGTHQETLYCENAFVPYRSDGIVHRRVLSILIKTKVDATRISVPSLFRLETF